MLNIGVTPMPPAIKMCSDASSDSGKSFFGGWRQ